MRTSLIAYLSFFVGALLALTMAKMFVQVVEGQGAKTAADRITGLIYWFCVVFLLGVTGIAVGGWIEVWIEGLSR
jgi:hypothetical protein